MRKVLISAVMVGALSACGHMPFGAKESGSVQMQDAASVSAQASVAPRPKPAAQTPDAFDTTTQEQRAAATAKPAGGESKLGTTVASLGDPTDPGFWISTSLVSTPAKGRVEHPATGKSVQVDLIPANEGGSRLSLPAMRLLGVSLTDLPEVVVYKS
ncbi:hypothetical protein [Albirhodobacter sp. R86504]|uniref:hypothetical protein n=1 Tax=Albirhodobacter sp. R86504 TaxID=3093848 RepID=UPI0036729EF7